MIQTAQKYDFVIVFGNRVLEPVLQRVYMTQPSVSANYLQCLLARFHLFLESNRNLCDFFAALEFSKVCVALRQLERYPA